MQCFQLIWRPRDTFGPKKVHISIDIWIAWFFMGISSIQRFIQQCLWYIQQWIKDRKFFGTIRWAYETKFTWLYGHKSSYFPFCLFYSLVVVIFRNKNCLVIFVLDIGAHCTHNAPFVTLLCIHILFIFFDFISEIDRLSFQQLRMLRSFYCCGSVYCTSIARTPNTENGL